MLAVSWKNAGETREAGYPSLEDYIEKHSWEFALGVRIWLVQQ